MFVNCRKKIKNDAMTINEIKKFNLFHFILLKFSFVFSQAYFLTAFIFLKDYSLTKLCIIFINFDT